MSFNKYLNKLTDKIQDRLPPQIPFSNKPNSAPPVPTSSKPSSSQTPSSSASPAYWQADFSPSTAVSANFAHECGDWGWGNNELENYTNTPQNSFHSPSHTLTVRAIVQNATKTYTSARLTTHQRLDRQSGYLTATISAPSAKGIWPAFWLLPFEPFAWPEDGEVDIMESWNGEGVNHACLHWGHFNGPDSGKHRVVETPVSGLGSRAHVYGFAWGEDGRCMWFLDGVGIMRAVKPEGTRPWRDFRVLLNVAVGGDVCKGVVPKDGTYDMVVHELKMCEEPEGGGWARFDQEWAKTREGHAM